MEAAIYVTGLLAGSAVLFPVFRSVAGNDPGTLRLLVLAVPSTGLLLLLVDTPLLAIFTLVTGIGSLLAWVNHILRTADQTRT